MDELNNCGLNKNSVLNFFGEKATIEDWSVCLYRCVYVCVCVCIYIYRERERERDRQTDRQKYTEKSIIRNWCKFQSKSW